MAWIEPDPIYIDPTPLVSCKYGAPMGRHGGSLDHDSPHWKATRLNLDSGGYDRGGAYWGVRPSGVSLYAVQDGVGDVIYVDAVNAGAAIAEARQA